MAITFLSDTPNPSHLSANVDDRTWSDARRAMYDKCYERCRWPEPAVDCGIASGIVACKITVASLGMSNLVATPRKMALSSMTVVVYIVVALFEAKVIGVIVVYCQIPGVVGAMASQRSSIRSKTPSRRVVEASEAVTASRARKRKRRTTVTGDQSEGVGEDQGAEDAEDEDTDEVVEITEEERLAALSYESNWRLFDEKAKERKVKMFQLKGNKDTYWDARVFAKTHSPSPDQRVRRFKCSVFSKEMA